MRVFSYECVKFLVEVVRVVVGIEGVKFLVGGINLFDLMKLEVEMLVYLVDVQDIGLDRIEFIDEGGLCIGMLVINIVLVLYECVCCDYVVLICVIVVGVFGQLCNKVIIGGNLLQCMCCLYFYDFNLFCNKCLFGFGCGVFEGFFWQMGVIGILDSCIVIYLGDMVVVLWVLDVLIQIVRGDGSMCSILIVDFYCFFGDKLQQDNVLQCGELIIYVMLL